MCDAVCDLVEDLIGNLFDSCSHSILCVDSADDCGPAFVAALILNANALDVGNSDEILPNLLVKTAELKLFTENCISLAESVESVACDSTETSYAETGTG